MSKLKLVLAWLGIFIIGGTLYATTMYKITSAQVREVFKENPVHVAHMGANGLYKYFDEYSYCIILIDTNGNQMSCVFKKR